jgi:hypothetical protein
MDNSDLRARMAAASRRRAVSLYGWAAVIAQYETLWSALQEEARQTTALVRDTARYARPDYLATFGHYATRMLADETALALTPRGRDLFADRARLPLPHNADWAYLDVEMLQRVLIGFLKTEEAGAAMSVDRLCAVLTRKSDAGPIVRSRILRHLLWLIKYGFVMPVEGKQA